ncbi:hypothetical protein SLITO_v1c04310 [Spiroplasma litorale]|uniref:J domain-containing protein n=1 Tax=Spiroplasma litorale TaxID=216942 RepID=A0A0K1W182_9MOLU|nr:hypothetical protein [Spiroplasma litorale]AKX34084.1 hypothetical protein SLITO_v1c04310 [Spiroplasma litorale]
MSVDWEKKHLNQKKQVNKFINSLREENIDDVEDLFSDDDTIGFLNYDDDNFIKIKFNKFHFINNKLKEINCNNVFFDKLAKVYYDLTLKINIDNIFFNSIDIKNFKTKIMNCYLNIYKFPTLIKSNEFDSIFINNDILNKFSFSLLKVCFYKFVYHISKTIINGINENISAFNEYIKNKIFIREVIKITEYYINHLLNNLCMSLIDHNVSTKNKNLVNSLLNENFLFNNYNSFSKRYKIYLENFISNINAFHVNKEIQNALIFFGLKIDNSYDDFKIELRKLSKKYHPDLMHNQNEDQILKVNYYRLILEDYFRNN